MKPLELRIKGINSFRAEQTIDFRYLGEYSIFGIFGPTGSGKSSILDAIILALYGVVPRAGNSTGGIINQLEEAAEVAFRFELSGAEGRQEYLIQRRYRRDKINPDGARFVSGRLVRVLEPDGEVLASKDSDLKSRIIELLGLSAQDFTRAVVLPQGKFAEFLALKNRERTDMLERIFALGQFGEELNLSLKNRLETASLTLKMLQSEMNGMGDASDAALELAREAMEQARQEAGAAEREEAAARTDYDEKRKLWELQQSLGQLRAAWEQLQSRGDEIASLRQKAARARQAEEVRPFLEALELLTIETRAAENELESAANGESQTRRNAEKYRAELQQSEQAWQEEAPLLNARLDRLNEVMAQEAESVEEHRRLSQLQAVLQSNEAALFGLRSQLKELERRKESGETEQERLAAERENLRVDPETRERISAALGLLLLWEKAQESRVINEQSRQDKTRELEAHEQDLAAAAQAYAAVQGRIDEAEQALRRLSAELLRCMEPEEGARAQNTLQQLAAARSSWQQNSLRVEELQNGQTSKRLEYQRLQSDMGVLESQRAALQESINRLTESYQQENDHNQAAYLARLLEPGEPCPVCGSLEHPSPTAAEQDHRDEIESNMARQQAELSGINEAIAEVKTRMAAIQAALELQEELEQETRQQLAENQIKMDTLQAELPGFLCGLLPADARQCLEQSRIEHEEKYAELRRLEQDLKILERERGLVLAEREKLDGILSHSRRLLEELSTSLARQIDEENELARIFSEKAPGQDAESLRRQAGLMRENDLKAQGIEKDWLGLLSELQSINQKLEPARLELVRLEQALAVQQAENAAAAQALAKLDNQIIDATGGEPLRSLLAELENKRQELEKWLMVCRQQTVQGDQSLEEAVKRLSAAQARADDLGERRQESRKQLELALQRGHFASAGEASGALTEPEELGAWEESIREYEEESQRLGSQNLALEEARQGMSLSEIEWEIGQQRLQQAVMSAREALERKAVTGSQWQELIAKNQRWRAIEEDEKGWQEENGRLLLLQSLLRGKDFVKYIAGEQLRYICQSASLRLQQLSRSRYGLELDSENNFVVRDDHNGGQRRAVSTLSGGETFLASLALALALSAQIQLRGQYPLEFFFLDEGFGTLDPELLETVMNSLESLRHERFMVGVISHVPELRNRLPRQLQVMPAEPGGNGTLLRIV